MRWIKRILITILLTILTQVGGVIYWITIFLNLKFQREKWYSKIVLFTSTYLLMTFTLIPFIAGFFGRNALPIFDDTIAPVNYYTILLNRHYVSNEMYQLLTEIKSELKNKDLHISYLDANHPFIDNYPLLPHLSHDDGNKLDIAFIYKDKKFYSPSLSGYGVYYQENSPSNNRCFKEGFFQYDFTKYVGWEIDSSWKVDEERTCQLIQVLAQKNKVRKIFLEPYLKYKWDLKSPKVHFHGCHAVRHDDHIHLEL